MSQKPKTKSAEITRLKAEVVELQELNLKLAKTLKMVEDGQWVVISETDLKRYQNGIKRLMEAGDAMHAIIERVEDNPYGPAPYGYDSMDAWKAAKASDNFGA